MMTRKFRGFLDKYSKDNSPIKGYCPIYRKAVDKAAQYGFIKRYPTRKLLLTGWDEPWHYRYVGVEAATFIMQNNLCYEEFYSHYVPDFEY